jgi:hypothetical protein
MNDSSRRQFLKEVLGKLALATGTVVLASTRASSAGPTSEETETPPEDIAKRADQLAAAVPLSEQSTAVAYGFLNRGFRNTPFGGFRNTPFGRFRNTPLGGFRNTPIGGFRNTPLGSFANGGWPNGGWGGFGNGGWPNGGWMNMW